MITSTIVADRLATSSVYRPARAGPDCVLVEASEDLARVFLAYIGAKEDERFGAKYDLTIALWNWRHRWIICGAYVFYLRSKNDEICVVNRSEPYPQQRAKGRKTR